MSAYYNENDPYAAKWLCNLIDEDCIAPGVVDDRSILDVRHGDLAGFTQCHFFAGIGIWSAALRTADWPDNRPIWTGSCPCQPFSGAGQRRGMADTRHLWPVWADLIRECRPRCVIGEQVASLGALDWLDRVQADLEAAGYAVAAVDLGAAGVGAPHWRQRLWWVAQHERERTGRASELADTHRNGRGEEGQYLGEAGSNGSVGNHVSSSQRPGPVNGFWADADWIECTDGKWRPVEPGTQPLAHGYPARVGKLRAYGNAICLPVAVEFIKAVMSCEPENLPNT